MRELHRRAMRGSVAAVDLVQDGQWKLPTPCAQWTVRQLVEHMVSENHGFASAAEGNVSDRSEWTFRALDDDLRVDYARSAERVIAAFGAEDVLDRSFWLPLINDSVTFPARQAISFHLLDYVIHGWDVATALGHPVTFDDDLAEATLDIAVREVPDVPGRHRPGASFRPPIPIAADASTQDRLLATLGRSPRWPH